jgi:hypothetical protein
MPAGQYNCETVMGEVIEPSGPESGESGQGADRRCAPRFPCSLTPSWHEVDVDLAPDLVKVHNISSTGIGLLVREPVKSGTVLLIQLQGKDRPRSRPLPVRVMHSTTRLEEGWLLGCAFVRPLNNEELQQFLVLESAARDSD